MRISDWSSDVCSSDLYHEPRAGGRGPLVALPAAALQGCRYRRAGRPRACRDALQGLACHATGCGRMTAVDQRDAWTKQNMYYSSRMPRHFQNEILLPRLCVRSHFQLGKEIVQGQQAMKLGGLS